MYYVCKNCFRDQYLKKVIDEEGSERHCDQCNSADVKCIDATRLEEIFQPVVDIYSPVNNFMLMEDLKEYQGSYIWEKLQEDWEVFEDDSFEKGKEIIEHIFSNQVENGIHPQFFDSFVEIEEDFIGYKPDIDLKTDWALFCEELKYKNRFFQDKKRINNNLLIELFQYLEEHIDRDKTLFRSRNNHKSEKYEPAKMGCPHQGIVKNGRANPCGIPYLYLASDIKTAIMEIKPFIEDKITLANYKAIDSLTLIDLRYISPFQFSNSENIISMLRHIPFLNQLGSDLSTPVNPKYSDLEYLPSQYICELIKNNAWDGVLYQSSLSDGYNIAIFAESKLSCHSTEQYMVTASNLEFRLCRSNE